MLLFLAPLKARDFSIKQGENDTIVADIDPPPKWTSTGQRSYYGTLLILYTMEGSSYEQKQTGILHLSSNFLQF